MSTRQQENCGMSEKVHISSHAISRCIERVQLQNNST
jgi:hypothetical protein